ncbi:MAG: hypothetical protein PW845_08320 [Pseudomonas sp.]|uniref:hypothetical protein n=1 Tax=Pseudomonas abieticivorans TaxID=2931382 RepID=UPI0020BFA789|nr:hypothetical protein [Pseudomonas sp. PIA16]MDE1165387.1 hypothetical protein [Pseudomonas sp.]
MNRLLASSLLIALAILGGCANHPEERGYSAAETRELALEQLSRRSLSFDDYQQQRARIEREQPASFGYEGMGEVSADRGALQHGRQG